MYQVPGRDLSHDGLAPPPHSRRTSGYPKTVATAAHAVKPSLKDVHFNVLRGIQSSDAGYKS